jgi:UDP-N-acetylmuramyl pentapeptide phosphotransferase/UDP-N-acetylglucosamine-1-phosphate transferase
VLTALPRPLLPGLLRSAAMDPAERAGLVIVLAGNAGLALLLVAIEVALGISHRHLVTDANAFAGQPAYIGMQSYVAALVWATGAAVALFAASIMSPKAANAGLRPVLLVGGAYMAIAGLDDLFMLHESSKLLGLTWQLAVLIHVGLFGVVLLTALRQWRRTPWVLLVAAALSLGFSQVLDVFEAMGLLEAVKGEQLVEECAKLTGISLLAAYMISVARRALT